METAGNWMRNCCICNAEGGFADQTGRLRLYSLTAKIPSKSKPPSEMRMGELVESVFRVIRIPNLNLENFTFDNIKGRGKEPRGVCTNCFTRLNAIRKNVGELEQRFSKEGYIGKRIWLESPLTPPSPEMEQEDGGQNEQQPFVFPAIVKSIDVPGFGVINMDPTSSLYRPSKVTIIPKIPMMPGGPVPVVKPIIPKKQTTVPLKKVIVKGLQRKNGQRVVFNLVKGLVHQQMKTFSINTVLRDFNKEPSDRELRLEMEKYCPLVLKVVQGMVQKQGSDKDEFHPYTRAIMAIGGYAKSCKCSSFQKTIALQLHNSGVEHALYHKLHRWGLSTSPDTLQRILADVSSNFDTFRNAMMGKPSELDVATASIESVQEALEEYVEENTESNNNEENIEDNSVEDNVETVQEEPVEQVKAVCGRRKQKFKNLTVSKNQGSMLAKQKLQQENVEVMSESNPLEILYAVQNDHSYSSLDCESPNASERSMSPALKKIKLASSSTFYSTSIVTSEGTSSNATLGRETNLVQWS